jgi:hypothetical protein
MPMIVGKSLLTIPNSSDGAVDVLSVDAATGNVSIAARDSGSWLNINNTAGGLPSQMRSVPMLGNLKHTWVPNSRVFGNPTAAVYSLASQWGVETDFSLVRFIYYNDSAASYTIQKAIVAPSSAPGDGTTPINAAGANDFTIFTQVFFNNAGADVAPQDQATWGSGTATLTIPANSGSLNQPTIFYSDWVRVQSLPQSDATKPRLLLARHLTDATGTFQTCNLQNWASWAAASQNRTLGAFYQVADKVTTPSTMTSTQGQFLAPAGVQFISSGVPGFTVLGVGDSLTQGFGSSTLFHGWPYLSCLALSTPTRPISYYNQGRQGSVSADYWQNGYNSFKACKPDVVTIATWTPNETVNQANADAMWSRAIDFAHYVSKAGAIPVLMGPLPWTGSLTAPQDAIRLGNRTRMLNAGQYGMNVLDWETVPGFTTGASPNAIVAGYLAADGKHPNDAGNAVMDSQVFRSVLSKILRA